MRVGGLVHWCEGLFLQPHHLQLMQRGLVDLLSAERKLAWAYPYGLIEARLFTEALVNRLVRFDRLRLITPAGTHVSVPDNADLAPLDIKAAFEATSQPLVISLGVPLWDAERPNATLSQADTERGRRIWRVAEQDVRDENTAENAQRVQVRRLNVRLLLPDDDRTGLEAIPLIRITRATDKGVTVPAEDRTFAPPSLLLSATEELRKIVESVALQAEAARTDMVNRMRGAGFTYAGMQGPQVEQLLRLRILNLHAARLRYIASTPGVTPVDGYQAMRELLAELASLNLDSDPWAASEYDHDAPMIAFQDVLLKVRPLLKGGVTSAYRDVDFRREGAFLVCAPDRNDLVAGQEFLIGIKTKKDPAEVAELVESRQRFKLMSKDQVTRAIPGVKLAEERSPEGLPTPGDMRYFRLLRTADSDSQEMWEAVQREGAMALRWPAMDASDFAVTLHIRLGAGK